MINQIIKDLQEIEIGKVDEQSYKKKQKLITKLEGLIEHLKNDIETYHDMRDVFKPS